MKIHFTSKLSISIYLHINIEKYSHDCSTSLEYTYENSIVSLANILHTS